MKRYIYGIDIGGTSIKFGLFDLDFKLIDKWETPTDKTDAGVHIIDDIVTAIETRTPKLDEVLGYGFGVPGPVVKHYIPVCVNLGWKDVDLPGLLKERLQNDNIFVGNDANVACLGEAFIGAGHGRKNVAMITLGTGVGTGIVVDGHILEGHNGSAGEIGHLSVAHDYPIVCNCGKTGCLETVASATGIRNIYNRRKGDHIGHSVLFDVPFPSAKDIFDAAKAGDLLALEVVDEAADYIGYACHVIGITTNPSVIVIGGGVSKAGDFLIDRIKSVYRNLAFKASIDTKIVAATLGNDAGIHGAAELVNIYG